MPIDAVVESADFQPSYDGEKFITMTFRVPADTKVFPGKYELRSIGPGGFDWSVAKDEK